MTEEETSYPKTNGETEDDAWGAQEVLVAEKGQDDDHDRGKDVHGDSDELRLGAAVA